MTIGTPQEELLSDPLLIGLPLREGFKILDRCVLFAKLGQGGMGAVYRGRHLNLDIDVAVKCLKPGLGDGANSEFVQRFQREARIAARIKSDYLVGVYDVSSAEGLHFLIMEYVDGESLRDRVRRKGALSPEEAATIVLAASRGLAAAHAEGVIHRDVKPDNIMISKKGEVKLADLGLARALGTADGLETATGQAMGTPRYMPPEQFEGAEHVTQASDVYSMAAVLFFLLEGKEGIASGSFVDIMRRVVNEGLDIASMRAEVPEELRVLLRRATDRNPEMRPANASEFLAPLEAFLQESSAATVIVDPDAGADREALMVSPPPEMTMATLRSESADEAMAATVATPSERKSTVERPRQLVVWLLAFWGVAAVVLATLFLAGVFEPSDRESSSGGDSGASRVSSWGDRTSTSAKDPETGWPREVIHRASGIEMILIPTGTMALGALAGDEDAADDERPSRLAKIEKPFYLAKYEVTNAEFRKFRPRHVSRKFDKKDLDHDDQPVAWVSAEDADAFCKHFKLRLPTEAEWEFAARANKSGLYPWGNDYNEGARWANLADRTLSSHWMREASFPWSDGFAVTAKVGQFRTNGFGLYDMTGNVWEWCADPYHEAMIMPGEGEAQLRSDAKLSGAMRVMRGGSFFSGAKAARISKREKDKPQVKDANIGFRVAMTP